MKVARLADQMAEESAAHSVDEWAELMVAVTVVDMAGRMVGLKAAKKVEHLAELTVAQ